MICRCARITVETPLITVKESVATAMLVYQDEPDSIPGIENLFAINKGKTGLGVMLYCVFS